MAIAAAAIPAIIGLVGSFLGSMGKERGAKTTQIPRFTPQQTGNLNQANQLFGSNLPAAGSYLQGILSDSPEAFQAFEAPYKRQFTEETVPDLARLFGGIGGLSSSGFQQSLGKAGAGLSERLASLRSGLKSSALSQLMGIGQIGLTPQFESIYENASPGGLQRFGAGLSSNTGLGLSSLSDYFSNAGGQGETQKQKNVLQSILEHLASQRGLNGPSY